MVLPVVPQFLTEFSAYWVLQRRGELAECELVCFFMWQLLGAPPVEVSVFVDVDEVLARLLAYMGQFINGCCSAGNTQEYAHDFFNEFVM